MNKYFLLAATAALTVATAAQALINNTATITATSIIEHDAKMVKVQDIVFHVTVDPEVTSGSLVIGASSNTTDWAVLTVVEDGTNPTQKGKFTAYVPASVNLNSSTGSNLQITTQPDEKNGITYSNFSIEQDTADHTFNILGTMSYSALPKENASNITYYDSEFVVTYTPE